MRQIKKGSTDKSVIIRIIDATDGTPEQAVEHDTSGIAMWYRREGETLTAITEAALASLDAAHSDGGIEHIDDGYYRLDLPDAAWATGASHVMIGGAVTGMIVMGTEVQLVNYDPEDGVRLGLTALPNAAADAAGGLPISDAGGLDLDAQIGTDIDAILVDTGTTLDTLIKDVPTVAEFEARTIAAADYTVVSDLGTVQTGDAFARLGAPAGASVSADIAAVKSETAAIVADTNELQTDDYPTSLAALASALSDIAEYLDTEVAAILALLDDPRAEPGQGAPPVNPDLATKIDYLFKAFRNKKTQTSDTWSLFNDAGDTVDQKTTVSDADGTATMGEIGSGP